MLRCLHLKDSDIAAWADLLSLQEADPTQLNEELADRAKKVDIRLNPMMSVKTNVKCVISCFHFLPCKELV